MIYLDNAATSHFKPKSVLDAINYDILHSSNSGRSAHKYAIESALKIEKAREYLIKQNNADNNYHIVFTKNCTEALNLAIFGCIKQGMRVITTANEHNSVLRPLYSLKKQGKIILNVVEQNKDGNIPIENIIEQANKADLCVIGQVSNVTGAKIDVNEVGKNLPKDTILLVDGAQGTPLNKIDMCKNNIDMLACPGHKGLHGLQGTGFLIFKKGLNLQPLLYGGTGINSDNLNQVLDDPEGYEAGTIFSGGISALYEGAKWSYDNIDNHSKQIKYLADECIKQLYCLKATTYTVNTDAGIVSFNIANQDSANVANYLDERGIAVRSGLHCAPLVHNHLGTLNQGAVRVSFGVDNTEKDVFALLNALEDFEKIFHTLKI